MWRSGELCAKTVYAKLNSSAVKIKREKLFIVKYRFRYFLDVLKVSKVAAFFKEIFNSFFYIFLHVYVK